MANRENIGDRGRQPRHKESGETLEIEGDVGRVGFIGKYGRH